MKRYFSIFIILLMTCIFSAADMPQVFGVQTLRETIGEPQTPEKISDKYDDCMPNAALVMFRATDKSVTKKQTRKALSSGAGSVSDITVNELWTFRTEPELTSDSEGKRKFVRGGSSGEYVRVALVRSKSMTTAELVKTLKKRSDVKYAEPNYRIKALSVTDDTYSDYQWSMQNRETSPNVSYQWETKGVTGSDRIVAVVDTGVDYTHPDLKDNMWQNTHYPTLKGEYGFDFIDGDDDPMDENGHGTHCAGIIGAAGNNKTGISGVCQDIRIMALRILDENGSAYMSHEIAAYNYIIKALELGEPVVAINNSWGGGEYSSIFADLIEAAGEKGAVTVLAAGNEGADNDEEFEYPSCIDSQYIISVAASRPDGKLADFSNYGKETVDVAAPGTDILSAVPYNCYNPSIYGDRQSEYSAEFNDYETEGGWESTDDIMAGMYLNGKPYDGEDGRISVSGCEEGFDPSGNGDKNKSLVIEADSLAEGELICVTIPYEISETTLEAPNFSVMYNPEGTGAECGVVGFVDVPQGTGLDLETIADLDLYSGAYVPEGKSDRWIHAEFQTLEEYELDDAKNQALNRKDTDPDPLKREVVFILYAYSDSSIKVFLDDMGLSVADPEGGQEFYGKYDFMSGTSMAAPYVSGAVALKAAELGADADTQTLVNETVSMASEGDLPVVDGRLLDFRKRPDELSPRIGKITVDEKNGTLTINGSGLDPSDGAEVWIGDSDETLEKAEIISKGSSRIVVRNKNWINNIKTVKIIGHNGRSSVSRDLYLVRGKKEVAEKSDSMMTAEGDLTTDGKKIYWIDSESDTIMSMDPEKADEGPEYYAAPDPKAIFRIKEKQSAKYSMKYDSGLVYCNGGIYSVLEYGMSDEIETDMYDMFWDDIVSDEGVSIYSSEFRLIKASQNGDEILVTDMGKLPAELEKIADRTMAAYNGKLYFIGGYSYDPNSKGISDKVWIYDPASKKWSKGPSLPEGRAGGKALQSGNCLIYTMGYSKDQTGSDPADQHHPANLIFDGKKWKKSSVKDEKSIEPMVISESVSRGGKNYISTDADISLVKGGLLYTGLPAVNYGDIFSYQTSGDAFADSGYNFIKDIDDTELRGIAVGGNYYGFAEETMYSFPVRSGLVSVTASKTKHGKVTGTGSFVPGNTASVKVKANKGYRIKSLKLNGKAVKIKNNQTSRTLTIKDLTEDQNIKVTFAKYNFRVKVKKKGNGKVTGAGTYQMGKTAKVKIKASEGWYIKSVKVGKKTVKVNKYAKRRTLKIKKGATVNVVFSKMG